MKGTYIGHIWFYQYYFSGVMEDGPLTLDDGTTDVQHLLVEPQDEHVSMDNVLCFNEKIPENAMKMEEVSCSFGIA